MIQSISLLFSVEDKAECIQQDLRRKDRRRPRWIIVGRNLNQIDADDFVALGHGVHHFQYIIIQEPAVAGRSCAGRNGWAEGINIDGDIDTRTLGDAINDALWSQCPRLAHT